MYRIQGLEVLPHYDEDRGDISKSSHRRLELNNRAGIVSSQRLFDADQRPVIGPAGDDDITSSNRIERYI